jgi:hypothetical protein
MRKTLLILLLTGILHSISPGQQNNLYTSYTTSQSRSHLYRNLVKVINKNLSTTLNDSTEDLWQQAFWAIELIGYRQPWIEKKVQTALDSFSSRTISFQQGLLELISNSYPGLFIHPVEEILWRSNDSKIFTISAAYLLQQNNDSVIAEITDLLQTKFSAGIDTDPPLILLRDQLKGLKSPEEVALNKEYLKQLLSPRFLPGNIIMYSFQRKNRNFPGLVLVRNANGMFVTDSSGTIFNVPQLARSITNLPEYIRNGNTPQGIFRMTGFDVSTNNFIGPSPNIQLKMPYEITPQKFLKDSSFTDTVWTIAHYKKLLPKALQDYSPLYNSYYAGEAGRTEIIAHGTTVNPEYYKGTTYYPHTPSQGCLSTQEIWDGKLIKSDQLRLVGALLKAGGANGYCVVVELDDKKKAVSLEEVIQLGVGSR